VVVEKQLNLRRGQRRRGGKRRKAKALDLAMSPDPEGRRNKLPKPMRCL